MKPKTFKQLMYASIVMMLLIVPLALFGLSILVALAFNTIKLAFY